MTFAAPLGLLALLAVPAVLVLHLFRRRLRERAVAGLFLWRSARPVAEAGRTRTRLRATASLWLELLAALLLALWLAGPRLGGRPARHAVAVLDDTASMGAVTAQGPVAQRAASALRARAAALASGDRLTVLRTGPRPEVLLGPAAPPGEVELALAHWRPRQPGHDASAALDFARELAGQGGEVWLFTDRRPPEPLPGVTVTAFGEPAGNAALLSCRRFLAADGEHVRASIGAFGGLRRTVLTARAGQRELLRRDVEFAGAAAQDEVGVDVALPPGTGDVELELQADALAVDDRCALLAPTSREVAVGDRLPEAVRGQVQLARALGALPGWRLEPDPARCELRFAAAPGPLRPGQCEVVIAPGDGQRQAWPGPFVLDRGSRLLDGVQLDGVVWVAGARPLPGRLLIAAGAQTLCSEQDDGGSRRVWLDLDAGAGNLPRAPDWPILLANLLEAARAEVPGAERVDVELGQEARFRRSLFADAADRDPVLLAPDGSRLPGHGGRTIAWLPTAPGRWSVRDAQDRELAAFSVRFVDAAESDLAGAASGEWPAPPLEGAAGSTRDADFERRLCALLLLLAVLADWWLLQRRAP